jgi:hypothetical protein
MIYITISTSDMTLPDIHSNIVFEGVGYFEISNHLLIHQRARPLLFQAAVFEYILSLENDNSNGNL